MAFETKDFSGALFKNDKKETPQQPDYRGDCVVDGVAMWISAWIKEGKNGKFMSLAFQHKDDAGKQTKKASNKPARDDEGDPDGIPF